MIIEEIEEYQMYINYIVKNNNFKYNSIKDIIIDLEKEFNIKPDIEYKKKLWFKKKTY